MKKKSNQKFKFLLAFFLLFNSANVLFAQEWLWLGPGQISCNAKYSNGVAFVNDSEGNFLVTGHFETKSISFGQIILENKDTSGQTNDGFIAKFDKTGNVIWANSFGGNSYDQGNAICEDKNHNVFITGDFRSSKITIGNYTFSNSTIDEIDSDVFIAKYDSNGKLIWAKSGGGRKNDRGTEITVDSIGNTYFSGSLLSYSAKFDKVVYSNP
ncbi:MAG: hypothetical protein HXX09_06535, partial [Bacteroidetes bacterium]|nr:hypothetical protein [Bacteroidota bacterium]